MGCRCRDIPRCSRDISRIINILSLFKEANVRNESVVMMELNDLAIKCFTTFNCKNMFELTEEEKKLNETLIEILPGVIKRCENKLESLRGELRSMRAEDKAYHEAKRRHKHHHN